MSNESNSERIQELSILENNLQHLLMQKQAFESQLSEVSNALAEVAKSDGEIYHVLGSVMLKTTKEEMKTDLESKKKIVEMRLSSIDKQEKLLEYKSDEIKREMHLPSTKNSK